MTIIMLTLIVPMTFADAPTNVPFPPNAGPKAIAHTRGCRGNPSFVFPAKEITIFSIICVTGKDSTKADDKAETCFKRINFKVQLIFFFMILTHKMMMIANASRYSFETPLIIVSVPDPINAIKPIRSTASIKTNIAAKNSKVGHSTR